MTILAGLVAAHAGFPVSASDISVRSDVKGVSIVSADTLPAPRNRIRFDQGHFCRNGTIQPKTTAGKQAAKAGWYVTSEVQAAGYTSVGAFSRGEQGTSGTCMIEDGNIAIYRGDRLVAIVFGNPPGAEPTGLIGGVASTSDPKRIRISDWTPVDFENADIHFKKNTIAVVPLPEKETACGGIVIPNIRSMSIPKARKMLSGFGWRPAVFGQNAQEGDGYDGASDYRKEGLSEFETCSGTGYGFCSVRYEHGNGAKLDVVTAGEEATVARYQIQCSKPGKR
jgi:hypothetical protein